MKEFVYKILKKYREQITYLIVGAITTFVSWGVFFLLSYVLDSHKFFQLLMNELLNWLAGVFVAYPLNRIFVFRSNNSKIWKEFYSFLLSRISTLILSYIFMWIFVYRINVDQHISKYLIVSPIVIIINYILSKIYVFDKEL